MTNTTSSPKRFVFHVGAHKTATSLVQKYARDKESEIEAFGIRYIPRSDMNDFVGWGKHIVSAGPDFKARIEEEMALDSTRLVFTSHENTLGRPVMADRPGLYPRAPKNLKMLHEVLDGLDVCIVLTIRPQVDFLESYYLQLIHEGHYMTFREWIETIDLASLSWRPLIERARALYGSDNVIVVDFRDIKAGQNEFLANFFRRIDASIELTPNYRPVRNPSISEKGLGIALAANRFLTTGDERRVMRKFLQKHFSNRDYPRPTLMEDDLKARIVERYGGEYDELTGDSS